MRLLFALFLCLLSTSAFAADLWRPKGQPAFVDANGHPYAGAKLCYFDAGTSNETTVYKDAAADTVWTQPIALDSGGGLSDPVFVSGGDFKEKLMASTAEDCNGTAIYTSDEIPGALDVDSLEVAFAKPQMPVLAKATNYTVVSGDLGSIVNADATGGNVTITLPSASDAGDGAVIGIRKIDASVNTVVAQTVGSETIDGSSTQTLSARYSSINLVSNGSNWSTISSSALPAGVVSTAALADAAVTFGKLATSVYDTDGTLAANSDAKLATQKATKTYVDTSFASGVKWKEPVRAATTADGTLASAFDNASVIDGVTLATNDRILIKNQSDDDANGIYVVQASGAPARSTDADSESELIGATVYVEEGTANAATQWTQQATVEVLETDAVTFVLIAAANTYTADGTTLQLSSTTFSVKTGGVGTTQIATDGVEAAEIAAGAVGTSEIATDGVGTAEIAALAVDSGELSAAVSNRLRDVGEVITFAGTACPTFSLEANGAAISRSTYSELFTAFSTRYGAGNGTTTFNIPDYRGYFLRGWNHTAGNDPDASSRTNSGDGTTGDAVGTKQADAFEAHDHDFTDNGVGTVDDVSTSGGASVANDNTDSDDTADAGGNETRPLNINVLYCIYVGA
jgi:microcystin-dependent protein